MAMGIPVTCNDAVGDTSGIVMQYHAGVVVREFTTAAYAAAVQQFQNTMFDAAEIKRGAAQFYSLQRGVQLYIQVYETIARVQA